MILRLEQFPAYYEKVHGFPPFRWQTRLLHQVVETGWPALLDLPTGSGKTSTLDIALFALALDASRPPAERTAPRRVVLVVDRRVVVSQAARHGAAIEEAIRGAKTGVLVDVREALRSFTGAEGKEPVLHVAELRGGIARDEAWAKRPDLPVLAASTVDQVGSRLLFRGYGVGLNSASIHAGLLGNDVLLLLDEVHLSEPFRQTLDAARKHYRADVGLPDRWRVVEMSATPGVPKDAAFKLRPADREDDALRLRLEASKVAALDVVKVRGDEGTAQATFAADLAERAWVLAKAGRRRVAVVVNRVNVARRIAKALAERDEDVQVDLVTGRMRPVDRDVWVEEAVASLSFAGTGEGKRRIVVATQCIEAGADFDFDALVTECASLDALRQRFGRLNRLGKRPDTDAVIVIRSDQVSGDDPVYGEALGKTWAWLKGLPAVDFGVDAMDEALAAHPHRATLLAVRPTAPVLLPAHLDLWSQTSQRPYPEPDPARFLHGSHRGEPEVAVVWRRGLLVDNEPDLDLEALAEVLTAVPPASGEALSLPVRALRAWLTEGEADLADVPAAWPDADPGPKRRKVLRWTRGRRGRRGEAEWIEASDLGDDDTPDTVYVVPAEYGGIGHRNWDPTATEVVVDLGDPVQLTQRGWHVRRVSFEDLDRKGPFAEGDAQDGLERWLGRASDDEALNWFAERPGRWRIIETNRGYVLRARWRTRRGAAERETGAGDEASFFAGYTGDPVTLQRHLGDVERWARKLAQNVGFPAALVNDLALAGRLHDLGKADPRFQVLLAGSPVVGPEPLAKSGSDRSDRRAAERIRKRSGYPRGARHELMSLALIEHAPAVQADAHDWDLVQHLVASHHGWCRPFAPPVEDADPVEVVACHGDLALHGRSDHRLASLDAGVADRFWRLQRQYGWWGLAWLEAVLRLADHRASEEEEQEPGDPAPEGA